MHLIASCKSSEHKYSSKSIFICRTRYCTGLKLPPTPQTLSNLVSPCLMFNKLWALINASLLNIKNNAQININVTQYYFSIHTWLIHCSFSLWKNLWFLAGDNHQQWPLPKISQQKQELRGYQEWDQEDWPIQHQILGQFPFVWLDAHIDLITIQKSSLSVMVCAQELLQRRLEWSRKI